MNGIQVTCLLLFFNHVGFKQEEESCPYAWLPFTGEHHKCVQKSQDQYHYQAIIQLGEE